MDTRTPLSAGRELVSVVFSFRNERQNIPTLISRLAAMFATEEVDYELIFVNDDSTDGSLDTLLDERSRNPRVKIVNMSRRFGVSECTRAGMAAATGEAIVYMDCDLQDPPEVIPELIAKWRGGADVVHTVRTHRHGESAMKMGLTRLAYRIIQLGSSIELPVDAGDFKLLSRAAIDRLLSVHESDPYLRGLVVWLGFTQAFVPYERDARHAGRTHFPFFSRNPWKTFTVGLTSFSFLPIYAVIALAACGLLASALLVVRAVLILLAGGALSTISILVTIGTIFWTTTIAAIAAVGVYVIRTYKDARGRPQYIVASTVGLPAPGHASHVEKAVP
jgi:glycosyltransferase involved in cell wall biosynthesis